MSARGKKNNVISRSTIHDISLDLWSEKALRIVFKINSSETCLYFSVFDNELVICLI